MNIESIKNRQLYCGESRRSSNHIPDHGGFEKELRRKLDHVVGEYRLSTHARARVKSRNIHLTDDMVTKLDKALKNAEQKGAQDTLVLLSDLAFIVNVPHKTVVTAMDGKSIRENVFTNIDSTVIVD